MKKLFFIAALISSLFSFKLLANEKKVVNITYVPTPFNLQLMVMREQGLLDNELAKYNAKVQWHKINSGVHQAKAMAAGSIDIASVMNTNSLLMAAREGNDLKIIGTVARPTKIFALVARKDFQGGIEALQGKKVAGAKGTVVQQMLVAQLSAHHLTQNDVHFINMATPKAFNALMAGSIDAALLTSSYILKAQESGASVLATADGYIKPILVSTTTTKFAQQHPELIEAFLTAQRKAMAIIESKPAQSIAIGAKEHGVTPKQAAELFNWSSLAVQFEQQDLNALTADEQFLTENGLMRHGLIINTLITPTSATNKLG